MDVKEAILARRSVRKFLDKPVSDEIVDDLVSLAMAAPSACNKRPWEFYIIKDEKVNRELEDPSKFHTYKCPVKIVVCGNKENFMPGDRELFWIQDVSAAIENILLAAVEKGLGTCWCGIYPVEPRTKVCQQIMAVDENIIPVGIICLGYPNEKLEPRTQFEKNKIHII